MRIEVEAVGAKKKQKKVHAGQALTSPTTRRITPGSRAKQAKLASVVSSHVRELSHAAADVDDVPQTIDLEGGCDAPGEATDLVSPTAFSGENRIASTQGTASPKEGKPGGEDWLDDFLDRPDPEPQAEETAVKPAAKRSQASLIEDEEEGDDLLDATVDLPQQSSAAEVNATTDFNLTDEPSEIAPAVTVDRPAQVAAKPKRQLAADASEDFAAEQSSAAQRHEFAPLATLPTLLGGYQIVQELGHGAMGAVYLGKQLSLNRDVAVKVIQNKIASDPYHVARFTREAYAAAQLTHNNVVQIYDLGNAKKLRFFSMEFVRGSDLGRLQKKKGRLAPREAAGYILQAAHGLKFAHDHGLVHRDIKPENLMIDNDGIVKVADLGLVKSVGEGWQGEASTSRATGNGEDAGMTMAHAAMGTPAYMPPEQADNAAGVDHRADIYSLGCTLYTLVTGRAPFSGKTVAEVLTKHKTGQFTPPNIVVDSLPEGLSKITLKMMARKPEDRYRSMKEVISQLHDFLAEGTDRFKLRQEHTQVLESSLAIYREAPLANIGWKLWTAFYIGCLLLMIILGQTLGGFGVGVAAALATLTPLIYAVYSGHMGHGYLYAKARQWVFASGIGLWLKTLAGGLAFAAMLYLVGWLLPWTFGAILSVGVAAAVYHLVDARRERARREPLDAVVELLRRLRQRGADEGDLKLFVAETAGDDWEEVFEDLYGYEEKLFMRKKMYLPGREHAAKKCKAWRDKPIAWLTNRIDAIKQQRDKRVLEKAEREKLRADGVSGAKAREKAMEAADAMVDNAAAFRKTVQAGNMDSVARRQMIKGMLAAARSAGRQKSWGQRQLENALRGFDIALGSTMRGLVGIALIVGCVAWMNDNGLIPWRPLVPPELGLSDVEQIRTLINEDRIEKEHISLYAEAYWRIKYNQTTPLVLPNVPPHWTAIFYGYGAGAAGIVLLLASLTGGRWNMLFILPAVYILIFGPLMGVPNWNIPGVYALSAQQLSLAIGGLLGLVGLVIGMRKV